MTGRSAVAVTYQPPGEDECRAAVEGLNLELDGELVAVGWGLQYLALEGGVWTRGPGYAWQGAEVAGRRVVYLGVPPQHLG